MSNSDTVLGKINNKKCYINEGKYGHYLTYESKNYKIPEWFPAEKMDLNIAERLIEYKKKMSEQWCEPKPTAKTATKSIVDSESDEEEVIPKLEIKKKSNK